MNTFGYTNEKNTLLLIALMKAHGISKVVASPGSTNISFVASLQHDPFFTIYSSVDERSAAYIACGLAAETGEPVALSCTGATASRNYLSGLTEAFYRKLPILTITSTQPNARIGQHIAQVVDRTVVLKDTATMSVQLPIIKDEDDEWECVVKINSALLELKHRGGGPVHINLTTTYSSDFSVTELPSVRKIERYESTTQMPLIKAKNVAILVGAHIRWDAKLTDAIDKFCSVFNGAVICDHDSNYKGKYRVLAPLVCSQVSYVASCRNAELLIHIGEVSGSWLGMLPKQIWRVNPDGVVRDTYKKLTAVFEMDETCFFKYYNNSQHIANDTMSYFNAWVIEVEKFRKLIPDIPFSNAWIAQKTASLIPQGSVLHLGILNPLRVWNYFEIPSEVLCYTNTGGFGIDGCVSALVGASLANNTTIFFGVVGDLALFYDMNVLGNRHVGSNVRLLVINNGIGAEFTLYSNRSSQFGTDAVPFIAAGGHFGNKSPLLLKHYAEDLGYEYMTASNKEEYLKQLPIFTDSNQREKPIVFEVFTSPENDSSALQTLNSLDTSASFTAKETIKKLIGEKGVKYVKSIIKH